MKIRASFLPLALALAALLFAPFAHAQSASTELKALVDRIQAKLKGGERSAEALAPELKDFDALVDKYKDQKTDEAAQVAFMRATLYLQVLGDNDKGKALLTQLKADYPGTKAAASVDRVVSMLDEREKATAAKEGLVGKPAPELHFKWTSAAGPKTLSELKGKVVVLDFWATWCGPCVASFPNVRELVEHYKGADVVVIGVTSLQGKVSNLEPAPISTEGEPDKEYSLTSKFITAKKMTWTVAFSEEAVFNPEYGVTGIPHMAIIAPDGTVRYNGIHPAVALTEKTSKIDGILKEFKLPLPKS